MEQNRESRNRPTRICPIDFGQRCKQFSGEISAIATRHPWAKKNESRPKQHIIYKNGCRIDYRLKCKKSKTIKFLE